MPTIPKATINNVDKCRDYLLRFVLGYSRGKYSNETEKTSEFDEWGLQFLPILFEGKSIKHFNVAMFLDTLKEQQDDEYYQMVKMRWQAIQSYFVGNIEKCVEYLELALNLAKDTKQPTWVIKDILIDIRNQQWTQGIIKNEFSNTSAQEELTESDEELYYPILDRLHESLYEKYIEGLYKKKTESPYTITFGNSLNQYGEILASSLIVSMYNGSLTHILLMYKRIKEFVFYLSSQYGDWNFRLVLYKLAIFSGDKKEIKRMQDSYPEILNKLTCDEAASILKFCSNHPIECNRLNSQLLALGSVGYFLDDKSFAESEEYIISEIRSWLSSPNSVLFIEQNIFYCLSGVAYRMKQDTLGDICCNFIERHYIHWYTDVFQFIANSIDLQKMSNESAQALVEHINNILDNEKEREQITYAPGFLNILRRQNAALTENMDKKIREYLPNYYESSYKLETVKSDRENLTVFIQKYTGIIKSHNETHKKNRAVSFHDTRVIAIIRNILLMENIEYDTKIIDTLISAVSDTLIISNGSIQAKLDAISLLICIIVNYPEDYIRNQKFYEKLFEQRKSIGIINDTVISSNIDNVSLKIGLQFLYVAMGKDVYSDILELMPYIEGDVATTIAVTNLIVEYTETKDIVVLPSRIEDIMLQYVLQWFHSENATIRLNATRILLSMVHNADNYGIVNNQLVNLIDSGNAYIKNFILRRIHKVSGITETTKEYIFSKCKHDANFVVRSVCTEVENEILMKDKKS